MSWRAAGDGDTVGGVPARYVAEPASTEEASAVLTAAATDDLAVVIRGAGSKLDWGLPPRRLDLIVDTSRLAGVVEHAAGDLITVVRAGTRTADLDFGSQQLALDPRPGATIGGTVAANTSGPRRLLYGTARDLLIGITVVRPDGRVARAGGKVVKNVAGYDLGKLFTGSYGTLGLITECVFRLHPVPRARSWVTARVPAEELAGALAAIRGAQVVPSAVEIDRPERGPVAVAVLLEGTAEGVQDRAARLVELLGGTAVTEPPGWFGADPWPAGGVGVKLTVPLSKVAKLPFPLRGSAGTGVLYATATAESVAGMRAAATAAGGYAVVLTAPPEVRDRVDMWGPVPALALMRRVKEQFDPGHRFAPGRFVGGI
ncbi:FAD-binding oxidoreductase [Actinoplanes sp. N902-109]|uniref:FAD-binding oxidoreductase n=1 Tax=Actinoplanes sp. (strain N902-109) TaxID=649831 RepID=UPI000329666B|nr:FAD-binding oxidoreductase [Actinoplanes sp. N902-109]AGL17946.1 FAD linked oxidase [Actinoplanes sp. N902-109]